GLFQGALKQLKGKKSRLWRRIREFFCDTLDHFMGNFISSNYGC
ncbi:MAG: hypothetical protein ACI9YB_000456, partial [Halioglobus sp.]